jgi:hypothetical protein
VGVWIDLFVGPQDARALEREAFEALIIDLIRDRIVDPPCALLTGKLTPSEPLGVANASMMPGSGADGIRQLYHGSRSAELIAALRAAPWGTQDLAVWFTGLSWTNPEIGPAFEDECQYNGDVIVYAFRKPTNVELLADDSIESMRLATYFALTGKGCPTDITRTPIEAVLKRHLGSKLVSGVSYS